VSHTQKKKGEKEVGWGKKHSSSNRKDRRLPARGSVPVRDLMVMEHLKALGEGCRGGGLMKTNFLKVGEMRKFLKGGLANE